MPECELCGREMELTGHHLVPKKMGGKKRYKKLFAKEERDKKIWLCRPCHTHIHTLLSEKELAENYDSLEKLKTHPGVRKWKGWIKNKPTGFKP